MFTSVWRDRIVTVDRLKLFECHICGAYTDKTEIQIDEVTEKTSRSVHHEERYRYPVCPNENKKWHGALKEQIDLLVAKPYPKSFVDELIAEILLDRKKILHERKDDVLKSMKREIFLTQPIHHETKPVNNGCWEKVKPLLRRENSERK